MAAGITVAAVLRKGGFYWPDYAILPGIMAALAVVVVHRLRPAERLVAAALAAFTAWWLIAGWGWGEPERALRLGGGVVAFGAAFLLGGRLGGHQRDRLETALVALGASVAAVGLVALVVHAYPLAMPHEDVWRLAGTFGYSNGVGLLLAVIIPLAVVSQQLDERRRGAVLFILITGLLVTLSRGAVLALLVSVPLLGRSRMTAAAKPAALAVAAALGLVATVSLGPHQSCVDHGLLGCAELGLDQVLAFVVLAVGLALAAKNGGPFPAGLLSGVALATLLLVAGLSSEVRSSLATRVDSIGVDTRMKGWSSALQELRASPVVGTGPESDLRLPGAQYTEFAHNEYLQVATGAGMVGLVLLGAVMASLGGAIRSWGSKRRNAGLASLLVMAVGGLFDFTWHFPAVATTAGWIAALSIGDTDENEDTAVGSTDRRGGRDSPAPDPVPAPDGVRGGAT